MVKLNQHVPTLDDDITVYKVQSAHSVLKEDKRSADGWMKAMATNIPLSILYVCQIIYNSILNIELSHLSQYLENYHRQCYFQKQRITWKCQILSRCLHRLLNGKNLR